MPSIPCKQCGHVNEGERVYCHNCGSKLDRDLLPGKQDKAAASAEKKRLARLVNPSRRRVSGLIGFFLRPILFGLLVAAIVQALRPPDGVPDLAALGSGEPTSLAMTLEDLAQTPRTVTVSEADINRYLGRAVRSKKLTTAGGYVQYRQMFTKLTDGVIRITTVYAIFDYPFYAGSSYKLTAGSEGLVAENAGGHFGRLPIHPKIMEHGDMMFAQVWGALKREKKLMDNLTEVRIGNGQMTLSTVPVASAR